MEIVSIATIANGMHEETWQLQVNKIKMCNFHLIFFSLFHERMGDESIFDNTSRINIITPTVLENMTEKSTTKLQV